MKKFTVPCAFGGATAPFSIYIGEPEVQHHPVHFQSEWLSKHRGGVIPSTVMDSIARLHDLAKKNNVSFEELCVYALNEFGDKSNKTEEEEDNAPAPPKPKK
jgi:hypothetical protein